MERELRIDVENLNTKYPMFPITIRDKGWVYGVWYCGTSYTPVVLYGQYPPTFLSRAMALFPDVEKHRILHCPSGTLRKMHGITVDRIVDDVRKPACQADIGHGLPFGDSSFKLILSDPPYSAEDSKIYGCDPWPMRKAMQEFHRLLIPGGCLGMLHTRYPVFRKNEFELSGLISVVCGAGRATRMFSIFHKIGGGITRRENEINEIQSAFRF